MSLKVAKKDEAQLLRIVDANLNRAKEGLRVCEDICRFWYDEPALTRKYKTLRHALSIASHPWKGLALLHARNILGDVGQKSLKSEFSRKTVKDIFYANTQRVKESIRVLEEFAKLSNPKIAEALKRLRYQAYRLEQEAGERFYS